MNLERAYMLMLVIKEAGLHGGLHKAIAGVALAELQSLNAEAEVELKERAEVEAKKAAEAEAVRQAEQAESDKLSEQDLGTANARTFRDEIEKQERGETQARRKV